MKRLSVILSLVLCLGILFTAMPVTARAREEGQAYADLSSDTFREAYRILEEGIAGMAPVITLPEELGIYYYDLLDITRAVCLDHPEYFWFLESWFYEYDTEQGRKLITSVTPTYYLDGLRVSAGSKELADAMIAFQAKVEEIVRGIPVNYTSDFEIALYLHDYLAQHVTYTLEGDHDSAYAALIHGEAACYGYSKAYQCLMNAAGVQSQIIVGDSVDLDGTTVGHAWNQVWIDGECYYTDVTWDDLDDGDLVSHAYFLVSLDAISKDHAADDLHQLPECDHFLDYYELNGSKGTYSMNSRTTAAAAAKRFRVDQYTGGTITYVCEIRFDGDMIVWLDSNGYALAKELQLSNSTTIGYYYNEDIFYIILEDPKYSPDLSTAKDIALNLEEVTLAGPGTQVRLSAQVTPFKASLLDPAYTSDNNDVATVNSQGMVTAVGPGTATITVTSHDGAVSAQCTVTVTEGEPHVHTLRSITPSEPTCTLDGNVPYYMCTVCAHRFADGEGTQELTDVADYALMATGHNDVSWKNEGKTHVQVCSCGSQIPNTSGVHADDDNDSLCDVCSLHYRDVPYIGPANNPSEQLVAKDSNKTLLIWVGILVAAAVLFVVIKRRR